MAGVLTTLSRLFGGANLAQVPGTAALTAMPAEERLDKVTAQDAKAERAKERQYGGTILAEKIPHRYGPKMSQIRFEPYVDSTTQDSPEIRDAMRRMLRSPWVKAAWFSQVFDVASQDWQVNPADPKDPESVRQAEFIKHCLTNLAHGVSGLVMSICSPLGPDGISVVELIDLKPDPYHPRWPIKIFPADAKVRDTKYLRLIGDNYGNILTIQAVTAGANNFETIDFLITKYLPVYNDPMGMAAFRAAYAAYWMLDTIGKLRAIHHEKRSSGTLIGTYEDISEKAELEQALMSLKTNTWAAVPKGVIIEVLNLTTASESDYKAFESDKKAEIVTGISLASLHIMEGNVTDARGNSQVQRDTAELGTWYLKELTENTVNRQFIRRYIDWNFPQANDYPKFTIGQITQQDAMEVLGTVEKAQHLGFKLSKSHYADAASLQLAEDPDDVLEPPGQGGDGGMGGLAGLLGGGGPQQPQQGPVRQFSESQWLNPWESFAWRAGKSRTGNTKAIGTGEDEGRTLYGKPAERALSGRELEGGDRESYRDRRKAVVADRARAVSIARKISSHQADDSEIGELMDHLPKLRREELSKVRTMLMARLGGEKRVAGKVERLKEHLRSRLSDAKVEEATPVTSAAAVATTSEPHIVTGNTFPHRAAIKAAGGKWDGKNWTVPAGTKLPEGLSLVDPVAKRAEESPDHAEIGARVTRPKEGTREVATGTILQRSVVELDGEDGKKVPVYAELHQTDQNGYRGFRVAAYYKEDGEWKEFDAEHRTETLGVRTTDADHPGVRKQYEQSLDKYGKLVSWLKGGEEQDLPQQPSATPTQQPTDQPAKGETQGGGEQASQAAEQPTTQASLPSVKDSPDSHVEGIKQGIRDYLADPELSKYATGDSLHPISVVWQKLNSQGKVGSLEEFKQELLDAHLAGEIRLGRADFPQTMDPDVFNNSLTKHQGTDLHFINMGPGERRTGSGGIETGYTVAGRNQKKQESTPSQAIRDAESEVAAAQAKVDRSIQSHDHEKDPQSHAARVKRLEQAKERLGKLTPTDATPQEGDRNAEGLVFRDGRWRREGEAAPTPTNDVAKGEMQGGGEQASQATPQVSQLASGVELTPDQFWESAKPSQEAQEKHDAAYREFNRLQTTHMRGQSSPPPVRKAKQGRGDVWEVFDPDTGEAYASYKTKDEATNQASSRWGSRVGSQQIDEARNRYLQSREDLAHSAVESALSQGLPVPPEVLADYPDLQAKYGKNQEPK